MNKINQIGRLTAQVETKQAGAFTGAGRAADFVIRHGAKGLSNLFRWGWKPATRGAAGGGALRRGATVAAGAAGLGAANEALGTIGLNPFGGGQYWSPSMHKVQMKSEPGFLASIKHMLSKPVQTALVASGTVADPTPEEMLKDRRPWANWGAGRKFMGYDDRTGKLKFDYTGGGQVDSPGYTSMRKTLGELQGMARGMGVTSDSQSGGSGPGSAGKRYIFFADRPGLNFDNVSTI